MPPSRQKTFGKADSAGKPNLTRRASQRVTTTTAATNKQPGAVLAKRTLGVAVPLVPNLDVAFGVFLSARICAALWSHITDCDETFNFWEPLHYLLYGRGLQTWEYSPEFALRSYVYLLVHGVPAFLYERLFRPNPVLVFYFVRFLLSIVCASAEVYFYKSICREFGAQIGRLWMLFQLFSPGMFIASTALLPSSFAMYACSAAMAAWWDRDHALAIFFVAIASLLGWPFAALVGMPIAFHLLVHLRYWRTFLLWSGISAVTILVPMLLVDSTYFGRLTIAPLNIVLYNVFGEHGPNLYGTEPWTFYVLNGLLNFNVLWPLALLMPFLLMIGWLLVPARNNSTFTLPHNLSLAPFYLWLAVFVGLPHKEERFLYPVYFLVALCAAISVDTLQRLWFRLRTTWLQRVWPFSRPVRHYLDHTAWMSAIVMVVTMVLGLARIAALYRHYHAPLDMWSELNGTVLDGPPLPEYNVCVGKDWYRFPGSFFLPSDRFRVRFVRSEFDGILPAYFDESPGGASIRHAYFNDKNEENMAMYTPEKRCDFMFDLDVGRYSDREPNYAGRTSDWRILKSLPFLDAERSHPLFRAFYVPGVSERFVKYVNLNMLQRIYRQ